MYVIDRLQTFFLVVLLGCGVCALSTDSADRLSIASVTPTGEEVAVTRGTIVIEFSKPMVLFGRTDRDLDEVDVQIKPRLDCTWRWTTTSRLACTFDDNLRHSTAYSIKIDGTFEAVDGSVHAIDKSYSFKTASLSATARADDWHDPTRPVVNITFSQPVELRTILDSVRFRNLATSELTKAKIAPLDETRRHRIELYQQHESGVWYRMSPSDEERTQRDLEVQFGDETGGIPDSYRIASRRWTIEPIRPLTAASTYDVEVESGITSIIGTEPTPSVLQALRFDTFGTFELVGLECSYADGTIHQHVANDPDQASLSDCDPDEGVMFLFTAPMDFRVVSRMEDHISMSPEPVSTRYGERANFYGFSKDRWSGLGFYRLDENSPDEDAYYKVRVYYVLDGNTTYEVTTENTRLKDLFGREISSTSPLEFRTGHRKPALSSQFHDFVMNVASERRLPIEVANLKELSVEVLGQSSDGGHRPKHTSRVRLNTPTDKIVTKHLDLAGWNLGETGQFVAAIEKIPKSGFDSPPFVNCLHGQVSPYGVNARIGHESSVAWVTDLQSGELVSNATVELVQLAGESTWSLFKSETDKQGIARLPGRSKFADHAPNDGDSGYWGNAQSLVDCLDGYETRYALRVAGPLGHATLLLTGNGGLASWLPAARGGPNLSVWGHTAKGIYQPGDVLNYKIYVREQNNVQPTVDQSRRYRLIVEKSWDEIVHEKGDIELSEFGAFHGEFRIPREAVGTLTFFVVFENDDGIPLWNEEMDSFNHFEALVWPAFEVKVLDFNPAGIRLETALDREHYKLGDQMTIDGSVDLLSGGIFSSAPVLVDAKFEPRYFRSKHPKTQDFSFVGRIGTNQDLTPDVEYPSGKETDHEGRFHAYVPLEIDGVGYGTLNVRIGVQEDTGNVIWQEKEATYGISDRFVGVRQKGGKSYVGTPTTVESVVVDPEGMPTNDHVIHLQILKHLRRAGSPSSWAIVHYCKLEIEDSSKECTFVPEEIGTYRAAANIEFGENRRQRTLIDLEILEEDTIRSHNYSDYPEIANWQSVASRQFNVGEVATVDLAHSHPGSQALVTVERLGILDSWTVELEGDKTSIAVPIKASYAPTVKVVVTVTTSKSLVKPRQFIATDEQTTFPNSWNHDVPLHISDPNRELDIDISTDKAVYKPGERVKVSISVNGKTDSRLPQTSELAIAVVDQGALERSRAGIQHFDPKVGFQRDNYFGVTDHWILDERFVMYMEALGNTLAEEEPRTNNKLLSYWMPNLRTGRDGNASFEFKVADRLTEWKIIAVGATAGDTFGVGHASIKTNLGIEVHPALPNQVSDTDEFDADFAILNRTDRERNVTVEIQANGDAEAVSHSEQVAVKPFERKLVSARTAARLRENRGTEAPGSISFLVRASDGEHSDALEQHVPVYPSRRLFVSSIYGTTTKERVTELIEFPSDIREDSGSLQIEVSPSLVNAADGKVAEVRAYPYQCWEQRLSTAVVAAYYSALEDRMQVNWPDADSYIQDALQSAVDYQSNRGGFSFWPGESDNTDLYLSAYTALAFGWLQEAGYEVPELILHQLLDYLAEYTSRSLPEYLRMDTTTVPTLRLMFANALLQHGRGDLELLAGLYEENPSSNLFAVAQTLEAAVELNAPSELVDSLTARLRSGIGVSGDRALIQHQATRGGNFLLSSTMKTTCSAISAFVQAHNSGKSLVSVNRLAELVRGAMFKWNHQGLRTSPHRASFCLRAIVEYAESLEPAHDNFAVEVQLALADQLETLPAHSKASGQPHSGSMSFTSSLKPDFLGEQGSVILSQAEDSRFYYKATLKYEPNEIHNERENYGIDIRKAYWVKHGDDWVELDSTSTLSRGDVVHVGLYLDIRDQRDFVIVDDPVPGALEPINTRLAKTNVRELAPTRDLFSDLIPEGIDGVWNTLGSSRWCFYKREIRHNSVRFMSDFLPPGRYRLYWSGRVISTGDFTARSAHAEAMYSPEIYGNTRTQRLSIGAD